MDGKYIKLKRIIIPTITMILISSMLFGVTVCSQKESFDMLQQTDQIELEYAVPDYDTAESISLLPWIELGKLETHPELREAVDKQLGITVDADGVKEGILYIDTQTLDNTNNSTLFMAMQNTAFTISVLGDVNALTELGNIAAENYTDVEADDTSAPYAAINAYFELLPDAEAGVFDGDATISRAQAMALLMRANTKVNESQAPESDKDFTSAVGATEYTNFAASMDAYAYINTSNGLNANVFNSTMTRGEYISLLMNYIFADYEGEIPAVELTDLKDAGDISFAEAISNTSNGVPSDMYTTLKNAVALGIIDEDSLEWDSALTKADSIQLIVEANAVHNNLTGYAIGADLSWGSGYTVDEWGGVIYDGSKDTDGGYDKEIWLGGQWIKEEGYKLAGCESMREFIDTYAPGQGYGEAWTAYALQNGADATEGECWIYYHGKAAGDAKSYAINKQTGERIEAGPHAMLPGGLNFWGAGAGITGSEYEVNWEAWILSQ